MAGPAHLGVGGDRVRTCEECGGSMEGKRADAFYCKDACRLAAFKRRTGTGEPAERLRTARSGRNARSGLQVSYRKAVEAVAREIEHITEGVAHMDMARELAADALDRCLSDRQRARLDARR
jgi:hypothetical protein